MLRTNTASIQLKDLERLRPKASDKELLILCVLSGVGCEASDWDYAAQLCGYSSVLGLKTAVDGLVVKGLLVKRAERQYEIPADTNKTFYVQPLDKAPKTQRDDSWFDNIADRATGNKHAWLGLLTKLDKEFNGVTATDLINCFNWYWNQRMLAQKAKGSKEVPLMWSSVVDSNYIVWAKMDKPIVDPLSPAYLVEDDIVEDDDLLI